VHEEDLPLAQQLASDRLADGAVVLFTHVGEDRLAGGGGVSMIDKVADAVRPISKVRGIGLAVSVSTSTPTAIFFTASLCETPEALLLVHHQKAEVGKGDVLAEQAVGADHDVDRPAFHPGDDRLGFSGGEKARQHLDAHRVGAKRSEKVWKCCCARRVVGTSTAACLLSCTALKTARHRHLGLAEADVAANEAVHRDVALHVGLDLVDGAQLVGVSV